MAELASATLAAGSLLLLAGFAYAAVADLRSREVTDRLWQGLGLAGAVLGFASLAGDGRVPAILWAAVAALVLEHMFPWDDRLGPWAERYADAIELGAYVGVAALVGVAAVRFGLGSSGVPTAVVAVFATVVFARILFEAGVLYGGADAKALMIAGLLVPMFPSPLLLPSSSVLSVPALLPFAVDLLMNAALVSVAIPIGLAARNVARRDFEGLRGFTGYRLRVSELPYRYVWLRDPAFRPSPGGEEAIETSEEDRRFRAEAARALSSEGITEVWVTPQIPFLVLMAIGALTALLAGNLVVDLLQQL